MIYYCVLTDCNMRMQHCSAAHNDTVQQTSAANAPYNHQPCKDTLLLKG
jgi:hypothetical protein